MGTAVPVFQSAVSDTLAAPQPAAAGHRRAPRSAEGTSNTSTEEVSNTAPEVPASLPVHPAATSDSAAIGSGTRQPIPAPGKPAASYDNPTPGTNDSAQFPDNPTPGTDNPAHRSGGPGSRTVPFGHDAEDSMHRTQHTGSLSVPAANLSLRAADTTGMLRDSTLLAADTLPAPIPDPYRNITPEEFFGEASTLFVPRAPLAQEPHPLTGDPFFQIFLLLLAALYARFVYRNLGDVCLLFARMSKDSLSGKQRIIDDRNNAGYSRFLNATWAVGLLFTGAAALKFGAQWLPDTLPPGGAPALALVIAAACLALALVQFGALALAGAVTLTQPFTGQLIHLRRTYFAVAFLALAPVCLLYMLTDEGRGTGFLYLLAAEAIIIAILFLKESMTLFISKKIPILHWFLYLCIVEFLPLSFVALMAVRQ